MMRNSSDIFFQKEASESSNPNQIFSVKGSPSVRLNRQRANSSSNSVFQFGISDYPADESAFPNQISEETIHPQGMMNQSEMLDLDERQEFMNGHEEIGAEEIRDISDNILEGDSRNEGRYSNQTSPKRMGKKGSISSSGRPYETINCLFKSVEDPVKSTTVSTSAMKRNPLTGAGVETAECNNPTRRSYKSILKWDHTT